MMAKWPEIPDASAEVERLRGELEHARAERDAWAQRCQDACSAYNEMHLSLKYARDALKKAVAERDDLAARLQAIQQSERKYTAAKLHEAAKMRKGEAL